MGAASSGNLQPALPLRGKYPFGSSHRPNYDQSPTRGLTALSGNASLLLKRMNTSSSSTKPTALVVEDEDMLRPLMRETLEDMGFEVFEADRGDKAIDIVRSQAEEPIQLLVSDLVLPGMNGLEVGAVFGELFPESQILYVSGYAKDLLVFDDAVDDHRTRFLPKPFTPSKLGGVIEEMLRNKVIHAS